MAERQVSDDRRCTATVRKTGKRCKNPAIVGGTVCRYHGGGAPQVREKAAERDAEAQARDALERLGCSLEVDPGQALMSVLWRAAGDVGYLAGQMAALERTLVMERVSETHVRFKTHPTVILYGQALDRLAEVSATCIRLGLEERRVRQLEADARRLFTALGAAFVSAGVPPEMVSRIKAALAAELHKLEQGDQ